MLVHGPCADGAASGRRDKCLSETAQEDPQKVVAGAHAAHQFIRGIPAVDAAGVNGDGVGFEFHLGAEPFHQFFQNVHILYIRHMFDGAGFAAKKRRRYDRYGRILPTADFHLSGKALPAPDDEFFFHCDSNLAEKIRPYCNRKPKLAQSMPAMGTVPAGTAAGAGRRAFGSARASKGARPLVAAAHFPALAVRAADFFFAAAFDQFLKGFAAGCACKLQ